MPQNTASSFKNLKGSARVGKKGNDDLDSSHMSDELDG